jgi:hypothetical protein
VRPYGVIFYPAGESHGMSNPGPSVAKYLVLEFHGDRSHSTERSQARSTLIRKFIEAPGWRRSVKAILRRIGAGGQ